MTARRPTPAQTRRALETIAATFGPGWVVDPNHVKAHVEFLPQLGGPVDTFRVYAVAGQKNVYVAQVPRAALEGGAR